MDKKEKKTQDVVSGDLLDINYTDEGKYRPKYSGRSADAEVKLNEDFTWEGKYMGKTVNGFLSEQALDDLAMYGVIFPKDDPKHIDSVILYLKRAVKEWFVHGYDKGKRQDDPLL